LQADLLDDLSPRVELRAHSGGSLISRAGARSRMLSATLGACRRPSRGRWGRALFLPTHPDAWYDSNVSRYSLKWFPSAFDQKALAAGV